jgi:hypothetical protein
MVAGRADVLTFARAPARRAADHAMVSAHAAEPFVLGRVTKYVPRDGLDPAENRLTEVTAGVLEHVKGLAAPFVASMLDFAAEDLVMRARAAPHGARCELQQRAKELRERIDASPSPAPVVRRPARQGPDARSGAHSAWPDNPRPSDTDCRITARSPWRTI